MNPLQFRFLSVVCLSVLMVACSRGQIQKPEAVASAPPTPSVVYPAGIVPPEDWSTATRQGVYSSESPKTCCFLAGHSTLTLDNPPGSQLAVFTFFVPSVKPLLKTPESVSVKFDGIASGKPAQLLPGIQNVSLPIPEALRKRGHLTASLAMPVTWVPQRIGLNGDRRELSVMLVRVGYI